MKIKVCGMRNASNIIALSELKPDFIGFIFYDKSPRFVGNLDKTVLDTLAETITKVGVFVNESLENIRAKAKQYVLQAVQLHGQESKEFCDCLRKEGVIVIKAFPISEATDFKATEPYEGFCDYFLFDTKTPQHGGSGRKFDWQLLDNYTGNTLFFLSGGINLEDADTTKKINHPKLYAIDINSKFETAPGLKDISKINTFIDRLMINDEW